MPQYSKRNSEIKNKLFQNAKKISKELNSAPVVIIVAGSKEAGIPRCFTGYSHLGDERDGRLRDLVGILETAKHIEVLNHFPKTKLDK